MLLLYIYMSLIYPDFKARIVSSTMSIKIQTDFPGGSVFIVNIQKNQITLSKNLGNTEGDWFYWCFRAVFDSKDTYTFHFNNG